MEMSSLRNFNTDIKICSINTENFLFFRSSAKDEALQIQSEEEKYRETLFLMCSICCH